MSKGMKASQVASNPYIAAALIDDLSSTLEDLLRWAERVTKDPDDPALKQPREVLKRVVST